MKTSNKGRLYLSEMGHIRDFSMKIFGKLLGLIVPKKICKGDFEAYLLALSGDHCSSDPLLG